MGHEWIKDYLEEYNTMRLYILDKNSGEQVYTTFKFIYVNELIEPQLDSLVINNIIYKLHKSETNYLEFIRELDFNKLYWLPFEYNYVFKERIKIYKDQNHYNYLYVEIEYQQCYDNSDYWSERFSGGPY